MKTLIPYLCTVKLILLPPLLDQTLYSLPVAHQSPCTTPTQTPNFKFLVAVEHLYLVRHGYQWYPWRTMECATSKGGRTFQPGDGICVPHLFPTCATGTISRRGAPRANVHHYVATVHPQGAPRVGNLCIAIFLIVQIVRSYLLSSNYNAIYTYTYHACTLDFVCHTIWVYRCIPMTIYGSIHGWGSTGPISIHGPLLSGLVKPLAF
jgi:hypothetical protein